MFNLTINNFIQICRDLIGADGEIETKQAEKDANELIVFCKAYGRHVAMLVSRPDGTSTAYIWHRCNNVDPFYYTRNRWLFKRKLKQVLHVDRLFEDRITVGNEYYQDLRERTVYSKDAFWVVLTIWNKYRGITLGEVSMSDVDNIVADLSRYKDTKLKCVDKG